MASFPYMHLIQYINSDNAADIHPPTSYVLNKLAFDAFGSWKAVQFTNGILNAAAVAWFYYWAAAKVSRPERLALLVFLATAATIEMWGNSLRWYAYFNPVFFVLYTFALSRWLSITSRAAILAVGSVILFHISYLALIAAPVLWGSFIIASRQDLRAGAITRIAWILCAAVILCLPQLYVFVTVHLPGSDQMGPIMYSAGQTISTLTLGNAVFPIDYIPVLLLLILPAASLSSARTNLTDKFFVLVLVGTLAGLLALVLIGLGSKGRNAVFLYPAALTLVVLTMTRSVFWIRWPALTILILVHLISVYNFVFHWNTVKGSFNTPFPRAMREIASLRRACPGQTYNFTHDSVLTYLIERAGGRVSSPYAPTAVDAHLVREKDCVLIIHTFRGVIPLEIIARYNNPLDAEHFSFSRTIHLGYDRFHAIKARVGDEAFPEYYIAIDVYDVLRDAFIPDWYRLGK
jgi:hypothetical protein